MFIATAERNRETVTSARSARLEVRNGERTVVLTQGQRVETSTDKPGLKIRITEYSTRIGEAPSGAPVSFPPNQQYASIAGAVPAHLQAELGWRLGLAFAALNLVVLALALPECQPACRSGNLMFALFAFIVYYNFMTLAKAGWRDKLALSSYLALLHGGTLALVLLLLAARHHQWTLRRLW